MNACGELQVSCGVCRQPLPCADPCLGGEITTFRCLLEPGHEGDHAVDSRWARMTAGQPG